MQTNNSKEKVRQLQNKLYLTAKKCDSRRFHALYDKVYRDDVLFEAWKRVKANKGSSGVDGIRIEDIEAMGIEKYLSEIKSELMDGKYKPSPVKRVMIPKPDGSERPLGIPTVKDSKKNVNGRSLLVAKEEDLIKNLNPKITGWKNYYSTKTNEKWMQALDWYIICTFTRWYNKKHQRRKHMSRVGFVRNSIYEKGLKKMARA